MAMCCLLGFIVLCCFMLLLSSADEIGYIGDCPQIFHCSNLGNAIRFPFTNTRSSYYDLPIKGCGDEAGDQQVHLGNKKWYTVKSIAQNNSFSVIIADHELQELLCTENDTVFNLNAILPPATPIMPFQIKLKPNTTLLRCRHEDIDAHPKHFVKSADRDDFPIYYCPQSLFSSSGKDDKFNYSLPVCSCSVFHLLVRPLFPPNPGHSLGAEFTIKVVLSEDCSRCYSRRGQCRVDGKGEFDCTIAKAKKRVWKVILGIVFPK